MAIILRFTKPWVSATSPITLRFGDDTPAVTVAVGVTIPVTIVVDFAVNAIPVDTTFGIEIGISWFALDAVEQALLLAEFAADHEIQFESAYTSDVPSSVDHSIAYRTHESIGLHADFVWLINDEMRTDTAVSWQIPESHGTAISFDWNTPVDHMYNTVINWLDIAAHQSNIDVSWIDGKQHQTDLIIKYSGLAVDTEQSIKWGFHEPRWVCSTKYRPPVGKVTLRFNEPLGATANPVVLRFTASPNYCYWDDGGGLIDSSPVLPSLDFKIPIEPQIRRYYLMQPTITCVRVSDDLPIVISSVNISHSRGQWARAVSLEFSSRIDAERAHNELLLISINGYEFYAIAEQPSVSKVFGSATYSSTGRSRVAELAAPYKLPLSYTNATARSFAGLLGDLLQTTGWTVELSGIPDFTIPAGAFSVGNKTPIEAVAEAVGQLGCMILTDDAAKKLTIVPRWPTAPWEMATAVPDLALHDAVITSYSDSVSRNPLCNVVWLRGEQQGISAKVKRAGSAGNIPAADISAQLIVDNQAARVAGTNALAETGDKLSVNLSMPVMADLPPATPGMLIGVTINSEVFKGVCDSWTIRATVSERGDIDIEQSITLISPLES
ncbi:hypothetical protein GCM10007984_24030 [Shewanella putrefaciens]|uniref:hypothetical protein n=1 Tax=Shewanella putrefaciens TaxID=24 RepID=UPI00046A4664|nr:hypothetical protein [Shewanella putrefaciens]AVV81961.1 hypothetical protein SPWS13_0090 [Shewanella putrefaciens]MCT8943743.1 hypothetical protein [Shewanella putrefaciens]GGN23350.1 hypothetical protein GCM10007984_24030 [Shewanella putrefaciens]